MDEAMKMMTEFILEENVSMKTRIRELEQENENLKVQNKIYFDIEAEWGKKLAELKKKIEPFIVRDAETNKASVVSIYKDETVEELCEFLRIPYDTSRSI